MRKEFFNDMSALQIHNENELVIKKYFIYLY